MKSTVAILVYGEIGSGRNALNEENILNWQDHSN